MSFVSNNWSSLLRHAIHDQLVRTEDYVSGQSREVVQRHITECLKRVKDNAAHMPYNLQTHRGNSCVALVDPYDKIVDSVTAAHIRRDLGLTSPDRNRIIASLLSLLPELGPSTLYRLDIANFFDTVDREAALATMRADRGLSRIAYQVIDRYDLTCRRASLPGLGRGLALSSTISEWILAKLDDLIRCHQGVYFYARFVDDIVVLAASDSGGQDVESLIQSYLDEVPGDLTLNAAKTVQVSVSGSTKQITLDRPFEFLGYRFTTTSPNNAISVDIAPKKVNRSKSKIILSFQEYCRTRDFDRLFLAIRYLSSNSALVRRGVVSRAMCTGIFYNYPAITQDTYRDGNLYALDKFTRSVLFGSKTPTSNTVRAALSVRDKRRLLRCSFVAGHRQRVFFRISRDKAQKLVEGWKHAEYEFAASR